jgi:hypothetical protein
VKLQPGRSLAAAGLFLVSHAFCLSMRFAALLFMGFDRDGVGASRPLSWWRHLGVSVGRHGERERSADIRIFGAGIARCCSSLLLAINFQSSS